MSLMPASWSRVSTSSQALPAPSRQTSRTGSRRPSTSDRNGAGNEPTTAGTRIVAPQSWWSHQIRSPGATFSSPAPTDASIPLT